MDPSEKGLLAIMAVAACALLLERAGLLNARTGQTAEEVQVCSPDPNPSCVDATDGHLVVRVQ
jgi:hypothetical protein